MIVALQHHSKTTLSESLDDFVPVSKVLIESRDILIALRVEAVVGGLVEHPHVGLGARRRGVSPITGLLLPLLNREEVNGLVLEHLPLLDVPHVLAKQLEGIVWRHWELYVVVRRSCAVLLVSQRGHLRVDVLGLVRGHHPSRIQSHHVRCLASGELSLHSVHLLAI